MSEVAIHPAYSSSDLQNLVILVVVPTIVATIAMWLSGRRVAGRYARSPKDLDL
jgi:hypothetical protein